MRKLCDAYHGVACHPLLAILDITLMVRRNDFWEAKTDLSFQITPNINTERVKYPLKTPEKEKV